MSVAGPFYAVAGHRKKCLCVGPVCSLLTGVINMDGRNLSAQAGKEAKMKGSGFN